MDCGPLQLLRGKPLLSRVAVGVPLSELEEGYATEEMDESGEDAESNGWWYSTHMRTGTRSRPPEQASAVRGTH